MSLLVANSPASCGTPFSTKGMMRLAATCSHRNGRGRTYKATCSVISLGSKGRPGGPTCPLPSRPASIFVTLASGGYMAGPDPSLTRYAGPTWNGRPGSFVGSSGYLLPGSRLKIPSCTVSVVNWSGRRQDQIVQPHWFGHGEIKATAFWLKGLPPLVPTRKVSGRVARVHHASPGPDRWKERSRTLPGVADAMARQWGR